MDAYFDIETTGLSPYSDEITVVGIALANTKKMELVQLFEKNLTKRKLIAALKGVSQIYTYNGERFDLPFVHQQIGVDLTEIAEHHDLMFDCWDKSLYGGFKEVERRLGITRKLSGMSGLDAVRLWQRYKLTGDGHALERLLKYNEEDVVNLSILRRKLREYVCYR